MLSDAANYFAAHPLVLLFTLMSVGSIFGAVKIKGFSLGPAAVLFTAMAASMFYPSFKLPEVVGSLGLALFAYILGLSAGPEFTSAMKARWKVVAVVLGCISVGGLLVHVLGGMMGIDAPIVAGLFAGGGTSTPALASALASSGTSSPVLSYALAYPIGVGLVIIACLRALEKDSRPHPAYDELAHATIKLNNDWVNVRQLVSTYPDKILISRVRKDGILSVPGLDTPLQAGDLITIVAKEEDLENIVNEIGHRTKNKRLTEDRKAIDFHTMVVSKHALVGKSISSLKLHSQHGALATRIRRGDIEILAVGKETLELGDRVRIIGPKASFHPIGDLLGDSERGMGDLNPIGLCLGILFGLALGSITLNAGGAALSLGTAGGTLIAGLVAGHQGRLGPIVWSLPYPVMTALSRIGLLTFLAYAGSNAGAGLSNASHAGNIIGTLILGALVTTTTVVIPTLILPRLGLHGPRLAGALAGAQTQPAAQAASDEYSDGDPRVSAGYALVYPLATLAKVIIAGLLTMH